MKIKFTKKAVMDLYVYIVLILTTYTSGFIYNFVYYDYNSTIKWLLVGMIFFCLFFLTKADYNKLLFFVLLEMFIGLWVIMGGGVMNNYIKAVVRITFMFIFYVFCNKNKINVLEYLCNLMVLYAAVYLAAWLIFDVGPLARYGHNLHVSIEIAEGQIRSWNYTEFFHLYYRWHDSRRIFGVNIVASNGPFWEPGLYQIYLNLALWYELFRRKKFRWAVILLTVAIIVTTSTMGAFILVIIWAGYLYNKQFPIAKVISVLPVIAATLFILNELWNEKKAYAISNVNGRGNDFMDLAQAFIVHPIIGNGMGNCPGFNALLIYIAEFGSLGIVFIIFIITMIMKKKGSLIGKMVLIAWLLLSLINEPIGYHSLFLLIVFAFTQKENLGLESDNREY